jgi:hypothetical protein
MGTYRAVPFVTIVTHPGTFGGLVITLVSGPTVPVVSNRK